MAAILMDTSRGGGDDSPDLASLTSRGLTSSWFSSLLSSKPSTVLSNLKPKLTASQDEENSVILVSGSVLSIDVDQNYFSKI